VGDVVYEREEEEEEEQQKMHIMMDIIRAANSMDEDD
jgi:hypothetical protein